MPPLLADNTPAVKADSAGRLSCYDGTSCPTELMPVELEPVRHHVAFLLWLAVWAGQQPDKRGHWRWADIARTMGVHVDTIRNRWVPRYTWIARCRAAGEVGPAWAAELLREVYPHHLAIAIERGIKQLAPPGGEAGDLMAAAAEGDQAAQAAQAGADEATAQVVKPKPRKRKRKRRAAQAAQEAPGATEPATPDADTTEAPGAATGPTAAQEAPSGPPPPAPAAAPALSQAEVDLERAANLVRGAQGYVARAMQAGKLGQPRVSDVVSLARITMLLHGGATSRVDVTGAGGGSLQAQETVRMRQARHLAESTGDQRVLLEAMREDALELAAVVGAMLDQAEAIALAGLVELTTDDEADQATGA